MNELQSTSPSVSQSVLMLVNSFVQGDARVMAEAHSLARAGYHVHIIGAARHTKGGTPVCDTVDGIQITLVPMDTEWSVKPLLRALWRLLRANLGTVTPDQPFRHTNALSLLFFNLWCLRIGMRIPCKVIHAHDLSPLPAAWLMARLRGARLIYDAHESAPDFYPGRKGQLAGWLERRLIGKADAVVTVGERLARALRERGGRRVELIGNWKRLETYEQPDTDRIMQERQRLNLDHYRVVIAYLGSLHPERDIEPLLQAVAECPSVALLISGSGILEQHVRAAAERAPNIYWLGWLSMADVAFYTLLADVGYYSINPDVSPQAYYSTPNKLFEAFAAGKAIIARRGVGELGEILEKVGAAVLLDTVTPEALKDAFRQLQDPQTLKRLQDEARAAREVYNWGEAEKRLRQLYTDLTGA